MYDEAAAIRYLEGQKGYIKNREPMLGPMDVNWDSWSASDHYYKGSWMLHTLRHAIDDDEKWWAVLKGLYEKFQFSNATTPEIIVYINEATGRDWNPFFEQYLEYPSIPKLVYNLKQEGDDLQVRYKWETDVTAFNMPVKIGKEEEWTVVKPTTGVVGEVVLKNCSKSDFKVAESLFYVRSGQKNF